MRETLAIAILFLAGLVASGQDTSAVRTHQMESKVFDNTRAIRVLLPPGYADAENTTLYPVLYLNDGAMVFKRFDIQKTVHGLINAKAIPPLILVGIDNGGSTDKTKNAGTDRSNEYLPYPDVGFGPDNLYAPDPADPAGRKYPDFLNEVMAFVGSKYRVKSGPENTGIGGASYGGVAAVYAVMNRPGVFGKLLIESTPLWIGPDKRLLKDVAETKAWPGKVYIGLGTKETPNETVNKAGRADFDRFVSLLGKKSGETELRSVLEPEGKHEPAYWAKRFPVALKFLYGNGSRTTAKKQ
ncbi:MAG TPA: alpha/beta hydrolase-fold protein [Pyrinomonadaceae bacterium]|jgi:predicted alpha/beta superfamily hydrolase|nr:alpha/beta hydrolase-fold protein [Pyrinomonadaceae bacterium]